MVTLDRIRLTGLLRKTLHLRGFPISAHRAGMKMRAAQPRNETRRAGGSIHRHRPPTRIACARTVTWTPLGSGEPATKGVCPDHPQAGVMKVWVQEQVEPGLVDWPAVQARLRRQGIVLVGGGADEAPEAYKRLPEVLEAYSGSIRMKHKLRPLGVAMAGRDVHDPYKD